MKKARNIKVESPESLPVTLNEFFGQETIEKVSELYEKLQSPFIAGVELGVELRSLNHWANYFNLNPENIPRKKYSFIDFVFLKMVGELRSVHVGLNLIASLKDNLFAPIQIKGLLSKLQQATTYIEGLKLTKEQKEQLLHLISTPEYKNISEKVSFTLLHFIIVESIVKKLPLSIAVFTDASFIVLDKSKEKFYTETDKTKLLFEAHVVVSISALLKKFLLSDLSNFVVPEIGLLSDKENQLFAFIKSGDYESITIHFKDKKMKALELKKNENIKERLIDILDKGAYGEITVKKHKGEIVKIENRTKIIL